MRVELRYHPTNPDLTSILVFRDGGRSTRRDLPHADASAWACDNAPSDATTDTRAEKIEGDASGAWAYRHRPRVIPSSHPNATDEARLLAAILAP